uniref:HAUS augmin like complex subunit 2 n=1 Tax=Kryptolebias marmoratus TaxID=37003 RepID=A0A3Q3F9X9_KRYMA
MHQWDSSLFSVTPAASLLSRCVSVGAASQVRTLCLRSLTASRYNKCFLYLVQLQLQLELLKIDQQSADVAHVFHLAQKNEKLQTLGNHLLDLLKEQKILRQRLMKPLARTNLPVMAHLHSFVVKTVQLMMDFIECLEEKLRSAQNRASTADCLALLVTETETLSSRILRWKNSSSLTSVTSQTVSCAGETE